MISSFIALMLLAASTLVINPINICVTILLSSAILIGHSYIILGNSWIPTNVLILFIGGILLIFIILSSTIPNENFNSINNVNISSIILIPTLVIPYLSSQTPQTEQLQQLNIFVSNNTNMVIILSIIILYFSLFLYIVNENNISIRSLN